MAFHYVQCKSESDSFNGTSHAINFIISAGASSAVFVRGQLLSDAFDV